MNTMNLEDRIALHTWTVDTTPLTDVLRIVRETGYAAVELRYDDYKRALESGMTREQYLDQVRSSGVKVSVMGVENGLIFADGAEREQLLESFRVSCANARDLACDTLMISAGRNAPTSVAHAATNFRRACDIAGEYGLKLALEFNSRHAMVNRTAVAREIVHGARMPNGGLL